MIGPSGPYSTPTKSPPSHYWITYTDWPIGPSVMKTHWFSVGSTSRELVKNYNSIHGVFTGTSIIYIIRIILACLVVAIKYNEESYANHYYAKVGGISLEEMNTLEKELLQLLDYNLFVSQEEFYRFKN